MVEIDDTAEAGEGDGMPDYNYKWNPGFWVAVICAVVVITLAIAWVIVATIGALRT